jgi:small subunit ribosomal protein S17
MPKKQLKGLVLSNKSEKTIVVRVERTKQHPKYRRRFKTHKNYKAHTEEKCEIGDTVLIEECQPISKDKSWKLIKKI